MVENSDNTTILVVDDAEQNVTLLSHVLKKEGYNILKAYNGEEALQTVEQENPDMILLDVMMPDLNGFEVCERLKSEKATSHIPIIFLSALSEIDSKVKGFKAGGVDYITKPFQREEVLARIDLHVRLKRLQNQLEEKIEALKEREQRLNALNKRKDELMRILSHDIRNPVTGIIGVADLLKEVGVTMNEDELQTMFGSIKDSGQKIQTLVRDLLDKDRAEKGIFELSTESVNLQQIVKEVIHLHQPTALTKNISFDLNSVKRVEMKLDRQKMDQVLGNLISNALKFTPEGGVIVIGLAENPEKNEVEITVSDNGVGIPEEEQSELLSGDNKTVRQGTKGEQGSGIGMDIIKQFTELHGGKVEMESEVGEGTTFILKLPKIN